MLVRLDLISSLQRFIISDSANLLKLTNGTNICYSLVNNLKIPPFLQTSGEIYLILKSKENNLLKFSEFKWKIYYIFYIKIQKCLKEKWKVCFTIKWRNFNTFSKQLLNAYYIYFRDRHGLQQRHLRNDHFIFLISNSILSEIRHATEWI